MGRVGFLRRGVDPEEDYASEFAMNLLMPEDEMRRAYREGLGWIGMLVRFGVPAEYVIQRMKDLGLEVRT